jgi:uncharacterized phage-associated protein
MFICNIFQYLSTLLSKCAEMMYNKHREVVEVGRETHQISFSFKPEKAAQPVLWLLHRHGGSMDKLKLIKMIFLADREHLVRYGRPIVGGNYVAMDLGLVSSHLKDYVEGKIVSDLPFKIEGEYNLVAQQPTDGNWLSESELKVLDEIYEKYKHIDSVKLGLMTHQYKAWKNNEPLKGSSKPVPYEDFFEDTDNKDMLTLVLEEQEIRNL